MQFQEICWQSPLYLAAVTLRSLLLRQPLGLKFTAEELAEEENHWHFGMCHQDRLIACVVIVRLTGDHVKLRQMAVRPDHQRQGVGSRLIQHVEELLCQRGVHSVELHAREPVVPFYERLGYRAEGDPFLEVTIRHQKMVKSLSAKT